MWRPPHPHGRSDLQHLCSQHLKHKLLPEEHVLLDSLYPGFQHRLDCQWQKTHGLGYSGGTAEQLEQEGQVHEHQGCGGLSR